MEDRIFSSKLAPYIVGLISEKRSCGYSFKFQEWVLSHFDKFIINTGFDNGQLTKELVDAWSIQKETESINHRNSRVSFIRQLAKYMLSLGIEAYIPPKNHNTPPPIPYILTMEELKDFLNQVDNFTHHQHSFLHQAFSYSVIFRLYICCGLRRSEVLNLRTDEVDLNNGLLHIVHSKGNKDRVVYMHKDIIDLCKCYDNLVKNYVFNRSYFFITKNIDKPISKSAINRVFKFFWEKAGHSKTNGKNPTIHSLRHTYVVMIMNKWMEKNIDVEAMMPYLSRQLGHSSVDGSQYYYHTTKESIPLIRQLDKSSKAVIPKIDDLLEDKPEPCQHNMAKLSNKKRNKYSFTDQIIPKVTDYDF
jgi:integrase